MLAHGLNLAPRIIAAARSVIEELIRHVDYSLRLTSGEERGMECPVKTVIVAIRRPCTEVCVVLNSLEPQVRNNQSFLPRRITPPYGLAKSNIRNQHLRAGKFCELLKIHRSDCKAYSARVHHQTFVLQPMQSLANGGLTAPVATRQGAAMELFSRAQQTAEDALPQPAVHLADGCTHRARSSHNVNQGCRITARLYRRPPSSATRRGTRFHIRPRHPA